MDEDCSHVFVGYADGAVVAYESTTGTEKDVFQVRALSSCYG